MSLNRPLYILAALMMTGAPPASGANNCDPAFLSEYATRRACQDGHPAACMGMMAIAGTASFKTLKKLAARDPAYREVKSFVDTLITQRNTVMEKNRKLKEINEETAKQVEKEAGKNWRETQKGMFKFLQLFDQKAREAKLATIGEGAYAETHPHMKEFNQRMEMEIGVRSNLHKELFQKLVRMVRAELNFRIDALRATVGEVPGNAKAQELEFKAQMAKEDAKTNFETIIEENVERSNAKLAKERGKARSRAKNPKFRMVGGAMAGGIGMLAMASMRPAQAHIALEKCRDEFKLSDDDVANLRKDEALSDDSVPGVFSQSCNLKIQTGAIAKALDEKAQISDGQCNMIQKDMRQLKKAQDGDVALDFPDEKLCGSTPIQVNGQTAGTLHKISETNAEFESAPTEKENLKIRIEALKNPELDFAAESVTCLRGLQQDGQCTTDIKQKIAGPQGNASRAHLFDEHIACESAKSYTSMRPVCEVAKNRDALKQALMVYSLKCMGGFQTPGDSTPADATN